MTRMTVALATAAAGSVALLSGPSNAASLAPEGLRGALADVSLASEVQHVWRGRPYCWYADGWHGAGWYRCGFRWRSGLGWGGPLGWNSWRVGESRTRLGRRGAGSITTTTPNVSPLGGQSGGSVRGSGSLGGDTSGVGRSGSGLGPNIGGTTGSANPAGSARPTGSSGSGLGGSLGGSSMGGSSTGGSSSGGGR